MHLTKVNPLTRRHLDLKIFGFRHGAKSLLSSPFISVTVQSDFSTCQSYSHHPFPFFHLRGIPRPHSIRIFTRIPNRPISLSLSLHHFRDVAVSPIPVLRPLVGPPYSSSLKVNFLLFRPLNFSLSLFVRENDLICCLYW